MDFAPFFDVEEAFDLMQPEAAGYLLAMLIIFYVGKKTYEFLVPYNLNEQLTTADNKAVALSFAGYMFALGLVLWAVLVSESEKNFVQDILDTLLWGLVGIVFLHIARIVNDKVILSKFDNVKELVEDQNVGTAAVECGGYLGVGFLINAALLGEDNGTFAQALLESFIFFVCGQVAFVLFAKLYEKVAKFDLHAEIEKDNVAAGVAFGMNLTAIGVLLSGFVVKSDSLVGLAVWGVIGALLLVICRILVDRLILPGPALDKEISEDQNWGAALLEGGIAINVALLLNASF